MVSVGCTWYRILCRSGKLIGYIRLACVGILPVLLFSGGVQAEQIGKAELVRNSVTGTLETVKRRIRRGDDVLLNEVIETGFLARTELRFLDDTLLTIGGRSKLRLDSFVYNPGKHAGKIVFNTIKGAFRFVSGSAPKSAYRIKTPLATIGVRGTVIDGYLDRAGRLGVFILQKGGMEVCSSSMCQNVDTPRQYVLVRENGQISTPRTWRGRIRGIRFQTTFPVGRGRFYIDPRNFNMNGEGSLGSDGGSNSHGTSNSQSLSGPSNSLGGTGQ